MAADVQIEIKDETKEGDIELGKGDLIRDEGLVTAVNISLFTDRQADTSDDYDNKNRRGWWGDQYSDIEEDKIGSKLWLLKRSKATNANALKTKEYIYEALEWMIDDGVVAKIDIETFIFGDSYNKRLGVILKLYQTNGNVKELKYDDLWKETQTTG